MTPQLLFISLFAVLSLTLGCVGTEVGNPGTVDASIEFTVLPAPPGSLVIAGGVTIDEAWLVLDDFELRRAENCNGADEVELEMPAFVEIISGRELPSPPTLIENSGAFCRLEMKFEPPDLSPADPLPEGVPDSIRSHSVLVLGHTANGVPFRIEGEFSDRLRFRTESDDPFLLEDGAHRLFVGFDLHAWFADVDLETAEISSDNTILLSSEDNTQLFNTFGNAFGRSPTLFRDANRNGVLEDSEVAGALGRGELEE